MAKVRPRRGSTDTVPYNAKRRDAVIESGGIPLDANPDYPAFLFKSFVESADPLPKLLCRVFPSRAGWYLNEWCRKAERDAYAWDQTRLWWHLIVACGQEMPEGLREITYLPRPHRGRSRSTTEPRDLRLEYVCQAFTEEGLDEDEIWNLYRQCFPNERAKDPRNSYRALRNRHSPWLDDPDAGEPRSGLNTDGGSQPRHRPPELPTQGAWSDPEAAVRLVFERVVSPFLLAWHFWGDLCRPYVGLWCELAKERERAWVWDEVRALLAWLVYWECDVPPPLRRFALQPRLPNPAHRQRKDARRLRVAVVAQRLEELGRGDAEIRHVLLQVLGGIESGIDESTVDLLIAEGREFSREFYCGRPGSGPIPWGE